MGRVLMNKFLVWKMATKGNQTKREINVCYQFPRQEVSIINKNIGRGRSATTGKDRLHKIQPQILVEDDPVKN